MDLWHRRLAGDRHRIRLYSPQAECHAKDRKQPIGRGGAGPSPALLCVQENGNLPKAVDRNLAVTCGSRSDPRQQQQEALEAATVANSPGPGLCNTCPPATGNRPRTADAGTWSVDQCTPGGPSVLSFRSRRCIMPRVQSSGEQSPTADCRASRGAAFTCCKVGLSGSLLRKARLWTLP
jgi:hypothetical protein